MLPIYFHILLSLAQMPPPPFHPDRILERCMSDPVWNERTMREWVIVFVFIYIKETFGEFSVIEKLIFDFYGEGL